MLRGLFLVVAIFTGCAAAAQPDASIFAAPPTVMCASEGRLPDPTDCGFYLDCTGSASTGFTYTITPCAGGTYYNACQGNCSWTEPTATCSVPCTQVNNGESTVSEDNSGIFSLCFVNNTASYLIVSACPNGTAVDPATGVCGNELTGCPVSGGSGPSATTCNGTYYFGDQNDCSVYYYCSSAGDTPFEMQCPANEYYISYNHSCVGFVCSSPGFFADPANCTSYYYCDPSNNSELLQCPRGSYYDSSLGGCRLGNCSNTCPGAGDSGGGGGTYTCSSSGFFPDPYNCSRYYYCDTSMNPTLLYCPRGSYFDESVGGCVLGVCPRRLRLDADIHEELVQMHPHSNNFHFHVFRTFKNPKQDLRKSWSTW